MIGLERDLVQQDRHPARCQTLFAFMARTASADNAFSLVEGEAFLRELESSWQALSDESDVRGAALSTTVPGPLRVRRRALIRSVVQMHWRYAWIRMDNCESAALC